MRLLDLYSCAGGAAKGYADAGFEVVGVDIDPQPNYPYEFHRADAIAFVREHGHEFDVIHASPPCQAYSAAQKIMKGDHPDLVPETRAALISTGKAYVIENVVGAPLVAPVLLCGAMFGLRTYRHRLFESSIYIEPPHHPDHVAPNAQMGRPVKDGEFMHVVGNFSGVGLARAVMGMPWATRRELSEAVPPAFTEFIGVQLIAHLEEGVAA